MSEEKRRFSIQDGVETEKEHVELRVVGQDGSVVHFRIKRHAPLSKLMTAYCGRQAPAGSATPSPRCFSARIPVGSVRVSRCAGE